jgi:lipopolysaccharide transport system permease protein
MLGKVYFPRLTLPVSTAISGIITFGIQLLLFLSFFIYYVAAKGLEFHFTPYLLLLPLLVMLIGCLGLGTGIIISALTTKYRDLIYLVTFGVQLLMFFSPVIVPLSMVSGKKKLLLLSNPMTSVIETFRYIFFGKGEFNWTYLGCSSAAILAILIAGVLIFNKSEKNFTDTI